MAKALGLTDLQLDIMRALWEAGEASIADVHRALKTLSIQLSIDPDIIRHRGG